MLSKKKIQPITDSFPAVVDHAIMMNKFANIPTVQPIVPFNPRADAEILRKAIKGLGTNKKALITVLCRRTEIQRQNIVDTYKTTFGKVGSGLIKAALNSFHPNFYLIYVDPRN